MDFDTFYGMAEPYLKAAVSRDLDLRKIAAMVKTRIEVFPDIADHVDFFEALPEYDTAMYTHKKMKTNAETSLKVSGKQMTPAGATEIMEVLGKEESLARIRKGIQMLEA